LNKTKKAFEVAFYEKATKLFGLSNPLEAP